MKDRFKKWLLFSGHRYSVTFGILIIMAGVVLIPTFTRFTIRNTSPLFYIASALIGGNITLITIVVAINQVILSQELESPGSLRDEIEQTADYRQAALDQSTPPTEPSDFLQELLKQTRERAHSLEELLPDSTSGSYKRLVNELPKQCKQVSDEVNPESDMLSTVIVPLLGIEFGDYIHDCHQLQSIHEEERHVQLFTTLNKLASDLENLAIARQYFTTAFTKEELAKLSRLLLYIGIVAVSAPTALLYQLTTLPNAPPPVLELFILTVLTTVISLAPLAVLIAFVIRIAAIAQNIAAITPFKA